MSVTGTVWGECCITGGEEQPQSQGGLVLWQIFSKSIVMTTESRNSFPCLCYRRLGENRIVAFSWCLISVGAVAVLHFVPCTWYRCCHWWSYCVWAGFSKQFGGKNQFACRCFILMGFFPSPWRCPGTALARCGMGRGCGEEVLAAVWVLQEQVMLSGAREKHRLSLNSETPWDLCWVTLELERTCPNWRAKTQLLFVPTCPCVITLQHHPCPLATCALCLLSKVFAYEFI